jgi:hypothetical protein
MSTAIPTARTAQISVNGGAEVSESFPAAGCQFMRLQVFDDNESNAAFARPAAPSKTSAIKTVRNASAASVEAKAK